MAALLAFFAAVAADAHTPPETMPAPKAYERLVWKVFNRGPSALEDYLLLDRLFEALEPQDQHLLAQLQATADTIYGNYALAEQRHLLAFPEGQRPVCPAQARPQPADQAILNLAEHADVVLLNELHTLVYARAYFLSLFSALHHQGYDTLALEALYPIEGGIVTASDGLPKADIGLDLRKQPLDTGLGGVYTREPIYAELIRQAYQLGFHLIAYDSLDNTQTRDAREIVQANVLAKVASAPGRRLLVFTGGSYLWKTERSMAQHLVAALPGKRVVSIDLANGYRGCKTMDGKSIPADGVPPIALRFPDGSLWSDHPERIDLKILMNATSDRTAATAWLYKPRAAAPIQIDTDLCQREFPCLIEAHRLGDKVGTVPVDRILIRAEDKDLRLYLGLGDYVISAGAPHCVHRFLMRVEPAPRKRMPTNT